MNNDMILLNDIALERKAAHQRGDAAMVRFLTQRMREICADIEGAR